jgi:hypothetical protein
MTEASISFLVIISTHMKQFTPIIDKTLVRIARHQYCRKVEIRRRDTVLPLFDDVVVSRACFQWRPS